MMGLMICVYIHFVIFGLVPHVLLVICLQLYSIFVVFSYSSVRCGSQLRCLSSVIPRYFVLKDRGIVVLPSWMLYLIGGLLHVNRIILVFIVLRESLFAVHHVLIDVR